jgi:hypothetical protein
MESNIKTEWESHGVFQQLILHDIEEDRKDIRIVSEVSTHGHYVLATGDNREVLRTGSFLLMHCMDRDLDIRIPACCTRLCSDGNGYN